MPVILWLCMYGNDFVSNMHFLSFMNTTDISDKMTKLALASCNHNMMQEINLLINTSNVLVDFHPPCGV